MRILRAVMVVVAALVMAGRYLQERKRLSIIRALPAERARDYYEAARRGGDTFLVVMTAVFAAGAIAATAYYFYLGSHT